MKIRGVFVGAQIAMFLLAGRAQALEVQQSLVLSPGWNAVFLEVEPAATAPATVFAGVSDLLSVWAWNPRSSPVEYIQNPAQLVPQTPYLLAYFPTQPLITNLHAIHGETAYLVNLGGVAPQTWTVRGQPTVPRANWKPNSFNLVGFHLDPGNEPLFLDFFSSSPAHAGQDIYVLDNATGTWGKVTSAAARMKDGEAFWAWCKGSSTFTGPFSAQLELNSGLDFGSTLSETTAVLKNSAAVPRTAAVRASSTATKLHYWRFDPTNPSGTWVDLFSSSPPLDVAIPPGGEQRVRLGPVRAGLTAGALYESNVQVTDGLGTRIILPVFVEGVGSAGLWVGDVTVEKVSHHATGQTTETPVGSPFAFRVIVHVDDAGQVRLLRDVVQLWQQGTLKPDPENLGHMIVDQPGRFVLVANQARLGDFRGTSLRDGQEVGRRISAATFGFEVPVSAQPGASFGLGGNARFIVTVTPADPTNPFLHAFNRDHTAATSYRITRDMTFSFGTHDAGGKLLPGVSFLNWGGSEAGGEYTEELRLLNMDPTITNPQEYAVTVRGTFRLRKVSDVARLEL